jgi:hypothetical protein
MRKHSTFRTSRVTIGSRPPLCWALSDTKFVPHLMASCGDFQNSWNFNLIMKTSQFRHHTISPCMLLALESLIFPELVNTLIGFRGIWRIFGCYRRMEVLQIFWSMLSRVTRFLFIELCLLTINHSFHLQKPLLSHRYKKMKRNRTYHSVPTRSSAKSRTSITFPHLYVI